MAEVLVSTALDGMPHGFSTRDGLEPDDVLPGASMASLRQVHSPKVDIVRGPRPGMGATANPEADAMVTDVPGVLLGIVTADCAPVLFADRKVGVVGAAHAGWRGAHSGILENTLEAMQSLGSRVSDITAVVGPTIAQSSYEVDEAFRMQFKARDASFFAAGRKGHFQFNLPAYVLHRLEKAGVESIEDLALDTYADPARFHSFRRATHRGESTTGRQISAIGLPE